MLAQKHRIHQYVTFPQHHALMQVVCYESLEPMGVWLYRYRKAWNYPASILQNKPSERAFPNEKKMRLILLSGGEKRKLRLGKR